MCFLLLFSLFRAEWRQWAALQSPSCFFCPVSILMLWRGKQLPRLPWHMWSPRPAEHIIQPAPGLRSQRIGGCYATHHQAAESGRQPLSGACWWTLIDLFPLYLIIWCASHVVAPNFPIPLGEFLSCKLPPDWSNLHLHRRCGGKILHHVCSVMYVKPLLSVQIQTHLHRWEITSISHIPTYYSETCKNPVGKVQVNLDLNVTQGSVNESSPPALMWAQDNPSCHRCIFASAIWFRKN